MTEGTSPRDPNERPPPPPPPPPPGSGWGAPPPPPPPPPPGWGPSGQPWGQQPPGPGPQGWGQQPQGQGGGGLSGSAAAGLTYLLALVTIVISTQVTFSTRMVLAVVPFGVGLALVLTDRRPEVRFNALQGILLWGVLVALEIARNKLFWAIAVLCFFAQLALIVVLLALMVAGFQGRHLKLPAIGDFAEQQASGQDQGREGGP